MTYREYIQQIVSDMDTLNGKVAGLRDAADWSEKKIYNDTRGILFDLLNRWNNFDDNLPDNRAQMELDGKHEPDTEEL